ncbi:MAG TPA: NAD(P)/FAD-dependent oxidoreductase [Candidatus Angelobacter sp.]
MDSCDVLIVGGGPAGSSCAWGLRSSGLHVVILDKAKFPRNKVCGGWITPSVLQALAINPADYARGRTLQAITGFRIGRIPSQPHANTRPNGNSKSARREVDVSYSEPVSYGIRRCEFDEYLLRRSGADVCEGFSINSIQRVGPHWVVNDKIRARLLIGAGGHFCPVAFFLDDDKTIQPVVAQEVEFEMDAQQAATCAIRKEVPELYFCHDLQGYGWCFRKENFLNIGLGRLDRHALPEHVSQFIEFLHGCGKLGFTPPQRMSGHAYLLYGQSARNTVDDGVLLIGDAAGLAYAQSGEGIRPAVESGLMAAQVIRAAEGRYTPERLENYRGLLEKAYGNGRTMTSHLPRRLRNSLGRFLLTTNWFCRRMVVESWFLRIN